MARPGLTQNRKWRRLVYTLGSAAVARGSLELIWDACYEAGNDYLGSDADVELAAQWTGEPGLLARALAEAGGDGSVGFIEPDPERPGWRVHDLFENAPDYVQKRLLREIARNQRGETISSMRSAAGKKGRQAQLAGQASGKRVATSGQTADSCPQDWANGGQAAANGETPAPAPAPAPAPITHKEEPSGSSCAEPGKPATAPDDSLVVLTLPCVGKGHQEWPVTEATLAKWTEAFPGVDPLGEARRMKLWLEGNPTRRKTHAGMARFTLSWLSRAQDQVRPSTPTPTNGASHGKFAAHHRSETDETYRRQLLERQAGGGAPALPGL